MTEQALLVAEEISKSYAGVHAVQGVSLSVIAGQTVSLIGPNGAGKSTTFGLLAGEHTLTSGRIAFNGADVSKWSASKRARNGVSRTFQVARFFGSMTVRENVRLARSAAVEHPLRIWDRFIKNTGQDGVVEQTLDRLDLARLADMKSDVLAQGDRKRLELAMAMVQEPKLLLLDEPTAGMSLDDTERTIRLLQELRVDQPELAIVLTAHDMDVVFTVSDRVVLMGRGKLILEGTPQEIEEAPETRELYLGVAQ